MWKENEMFIIISIWILLWQCKILWTYNSLKEEFKPIGVAHFFLVILNLWLCISSVNTMFATIFLVVCCWVCFRSEVWIHLNICTAYQYSINRLVSHLLYQYLVYLINFRNYVFAFLKKTKLKHDLPFSTTFLFLRYPVHIMT